MLCPCCNRELPSDLNMVVSLETFHVTARGRSLKLEPDMAALLHTLARAYPYPGRYDELVLAVYGGSDMPEGANNIVKTQISKLRRKLHYVGYQIINVWGVGYRLVDQVAAQEAINGQGKADRAAHDREAAKA